MSMETDDLAELPHRIRGWRESKGLSRQGLADKLGVTVAAVYQWEGSGGHTAVPSTANLIAMAEVFGISMIQFWGKYPPVKKARRAS